VTEAADAFLLRWRIIKGVNVCRAFFIASIGLSAFAQGSMNHVPRFEEYPAGKLFRGVPAAPSLNTSDERSFQSVIAEGVARGWGVFDGITRKEVATPGPNFAGHYILIHFGCGDPEFTQCIMAAIVDAQTGRVYSVAGPLTGFAIKSRFNIFAAVGAQHPPYSFHGAEAQSPFDYRLTSRLLVANVCEGFRPWGGSVTGFEKTGCGPHFYVMEKRGLRLIYRGDLTTLRKW
jgi:hypothetical protein